MRLVKSRFWCWRCGYKRLERLSFRYLWAIRFKCFYCRIDTLDKKYGPSMQAELCKRNGKYLKAPQTRWEDLLRH